MSARSLFSAVICLLTLHANSATAAELYWQLNAYTRTAEIFIEGKIEIGDEERFRHVVLEIIDKKLPLEGVSIYSLGGAVRPALHIGRQIRLLRLGTSGPVRVAALGPDGVSCRRAAYDQSGNTIRSKHWTRNSRSQTEFSRNDSGCLCASACFLIWAAGSERAGDWIGVHRPSFDPKEFGALSPQQADEQYSAMAQEIKAYLDEMGIPESITRKMMAASSRQMFYLSSDEARMLRDHASLTELIIARCGDIETTSLQAADAAKRGAMGEWKRLSQSVEAMVPCRNTIRHQQFEENVQKYLRAYGGR